MPSVRQQVAEVPAELFKEGGETALDRMHRICVAIWETGVSRAKEVPSSDHTGKDPSEHRNGNCRRIPTTKGDKRSNYESQNTGAQSTRTPTTAL